MAVENAVCRLHVWLIVNLTSGHGSGRVVLNRIEKELHKNFPKILIRVRLASEVLQHDDISPLGDDMDADSYCKMGGNSKRDFRPTATDDGVSSFVQQGGLQVDIITTEEKVRGHKVAEHVAQRVVATRLRHCLGGATLAPAVVSKTGINTKQISMMYGGLSLHVFVPIGGDGSLNDVINGMCQGTLQAFRDVCRRQLEASRAATSSQCWSKKYYWRSLEDKSILRHFLPPLIYVPAGTGSDFARLNLCCRNEVEFVTTLRGICSLFIAQPHVFCSSLTRSEKAQKHQEHDNECGGASKPFSSLYGDEGAASLGFEACDVDLGCVMFPRSGKSYFFINECSCGMSCDVILKCERYKKNRFLSLAGGTAMFAAASMVSVAQIKPRPLRILALPDAVALPSNTLIALCTSSEILHTHILAGQVALQGVQSDLQWLQNLECDTALPSKEPLLAGADYFVYERTRPLRDPSEIVTSSGMSDGVNPFYTEWRARKASRPDEILRAISAADAHSTWIYIPSSTLVFGNGRWFGGGLLVAPHASPTDGLLSVTNWKAQFFRFVFSALSLYNGKHTKWKSTTTWKMTRCIVDLDASAFCTCAATDEKCGEEIMMFCETDGELRERLPAIVEVFTVVTMFVPQRCSSDKKKRWWQKYH